MSYDDTSFYGDLVVDEYDDKNNFVGTRTSSGFYIYHILGDSFDMMSDQCSQFLNDFSILSANASSLDKFWGVSYNMPRPSLPIPYSLIFNDVGTTIDSNLNYWYWDSNYGTGSVSDDGTTFTANSTSNYLTGSALTTEPYPNVDIYIYDFPFTVEFDILSYNDPNTTGAMTRVRIYNATDNHNAYWNFKDYGVGHYKIVCEEGSQKLYFNGVEQSRSFTFTTTNGHWVCSLQTYGHIKYKNFKIFDMDTPSTRPMTDEEYRVYLYLRNCRLLTMEDIEINMNKAFGTDDFKVYFSEETNYLNSTDHLVYNATVTDTSNLAKNSDDTTDDYIINQASLDDDVHLLEGNLSNTEDFIQIVNVPYQEWDSSFLEFLEQYISVKGNLKIKEYHL